MYRSDTLAKTQPSLSSRSAHVRLTGSQRRSHQNHSQMVPIILPTLKGEKRNNICPSEQFDACIMQHIESAFYLVASIVGPYCVCYKEKVKCVSKTDVIRYFYTKALKSKDIRRYTKAHPHIWYVCCSKTKCGRFVYMCILPVPCCLIHEGKESIMGT